MTDFDFSEYSYDAGSMSTGDVQFEFVDSPALVGDDVEWSFRTVAGATAPAGSVVAHIAAVSHDHNILGGGTTTIRDALGPHDVAGSRIHPLQYTPNDGDYSFTITIGTDARQVAYRIADRRVHAA
jgi:hypothetical protein